MMMRGEGIALQFSLQFFFLQFSQIIGATAAAPTTPEPFSLSSCSVHNQYF